MSLTTITIDGVDYQAYASLAEADPYLAADPIRSAAWAAAVEDNKRIYLVAATRRLDLLRWAGQPTDASQRTEFPRTGLTFRGEPIPDNEIPAALEHATILLAGTIASTPRAAGKATTRSIRKVRAGPAEIEFFSGGEQSAPLIADETAFELIRQWVSGGRTAGTGPFVSGACPSESRTDDNYIRTRGFA